MAVGLLSGVSFGTAAFGRTERSGAEHPLERWRQVDPDKRIAATGAERTNWWTTFRYSYNVQMLLQSERFGALAGSGSETLRRLLQDEVEAPEAFVAVRHINDDGRELVVLAFATDEALLVNYRPQNRDEVDEGWVDIYQTDDTAAYPKGRVFRGEVAPEAESVGQVQVSPGHGRGFSPSHCRSVATSIAGGTNAARRNAQSIGFVRCNAAC